MTKNDIHSQLENHSLLTEFARRGLENTMVWHPTADDSAIENRQLCRLLEWVEKYEACGSNHEAMIAEGYEFQPILPCRDPDIDWLYFERLNAGSR